MGFPKSCLKSFNEEISMPNNKHWQEGRKCLYVMEYYAAMKNTEILYDGYRLITKINCLVKRSRYMTMFQNDTICTRESRICACDSWLYMHKIFLQRTYKKLIPSLVSGEGNWVAETGRRYFIMYPFVFATMWLC